MLQKEKVNILLDATYGSSSKGQVVTAIADKYRPEILMANHSTSASHTVMDRETKEEFVFKALPSASFLNKIRSDYEPLVVMSPSSGFQIDQLIKEAKYCNLKKSQIIIPSRAVVITSEHQKMEAGTNGTLHLGSTMSGQSYAFSEKMTRQPNTKLAKDYPELAEYAIVLPDTEYFPAFLAELVKGNTILAEMPQGFPLSIDYGPEYPYSTFRNISPSQFLADVGLHTDYLGSVIANVRSMPIRVSNRFRNNSMDDVTLELSDGVTVKPSEIGADYSDINAIAYDVNFKNKPRYFGRYLITHIDGMTGTSGPFEPDMHETSWRNLSEKLTKMSGKDVNVKEITTLTKLNRRICEVEGSISKDLMYKTMITVKPTHVSFTFLNYIDSNVTDKTDWLGISTPVIKEWLTRAEDQLGEVGDAAQMEPPQICAVQSGPYLDNVLFTEGKAPWRQ